MTQKRQSAVYRFLAIIEKVGNALPHPATLFGLFSILIIILSWIFSITGTTAIHPGTGDTISPFNLISIDGLNRILTEMVKNFTGFAPLGTVLVSLLGIGIAEGSGMIGTVLRQIVLKAPDRLLTFVIVFAGVLSNTASEVGYVLLVPLGAIIFLAAGKNPLAGLAAAFAGVSGGYSANLLLGTVDPLLAGLSTEAAHIIDVNYEVSPAANYYFMAGSTFVIAALGTWVTEKIVIPRLGEYTGDEKPEELHPITLDERLGLKYATIATVLVTLVLIWSILPIGSVGGTGGFLRNQETGDWLKSPFMSSIVAFIFLGAAIAGIAYGIGAKTYKSDEDVVNGMSKSMQTLGSYIVLVFFAAQFVAYFNWSNLGLIMAIKGAELLKSSGLGSIPLMIALISISAIINLCMGSASAKWAIMAPVFIPMFMLLGYSPEFTQLAYRIGDSVTNIISPMMSYFALIVAFIQRYDKKAGIGTVISTMLPYSVVFFIGWVLLMVIWILMGLPIGPGSPLDYQFGG
ncbi:MAG: AbgT family transporter [Bacteroidetes bacterium]|nr:AbgT family transporter [Bacteroidota bacterium]MDA1121517.1 AbgT family transporter [Bacteroidota bacterium]